MILPNLDEIQVPQQVLDYPSMITESEKRLLFWLAATYYLGNGLIVDAGIFLGGSTNAFATGINNNHSISRSTCKPIQSYDIGIWVDSMNRYLEFDNVNQALGSLVLQAGDSFAPILKRLLSSHDAVVDIKIGNILQTAYADMPVEIAFYDCLKTNERDIAVFKAFAPHYIPGRTIVLQQDYFYESAGYNKIRQEYFADYFEYVGQVSTTAVFRNVVAIPIEQVLNDPVSALPLDQKIELLDRAVARASNNKTRILTQLSIVDFLIDEKQNDLARQYLGRTEYEMSSLSLNEITRRPENIVSGFKKRIGSL